MASGKIVGVVRQIVQPSTLYATLDTRLGGSTPAENFPVYDFDDTTEEYLDFYCRLDGYGGGGLTVTFDWSSGIATTGDVRWGAAIRRIADDAEDVDSSHTYVFQEATDTTASVAGERSRATITFANGSAMDDLADGESFVLRIRREPGDAADNFSGDAELWPSTLLIKET